MEIREFDENGMHIKETWDGDVRIGREETPLATLPPIAPQPTNQEVMDMQMTIMDLVVGVLENQMGGL